MMIKGPHKDCDCSKPERFYVNPISDKSDIDKQQQIINDVISTTGPTQDQCASQGFPVQSDCAVIHDKYLANDNNVWNPEANGATCYQDGNNRWCTVGTWNTCDVAIGWDVTSVAKGGDLG